MSRPAAASAAVAAAVMAATLAGALPALGVGARTPPGRTAQALPPPVLLRTATAELVRGFVCVRPRGAPRCEPLVGARTIPFGTFLDATRGTVRITAANGRGGFQSANFWAGPFVLSQARSGQVGLLLSGGPARDCPDAGGASAAVSRRIRRVWGNGRGRFRTRGRFGAAAVRGTRWLTYDRCDGTYFQSTSGEVLIEDFTRRRNVLLRAGRSYLAPPVNP
jgi:hypothetical protein